MISNCHCLIIISWSLCASYCRKAVNQLLRKIQGNLVRSMGPRFRVAVESVIEDLKSQLQLLVDGVTQAAGKDSPRSISNGASIAGRLTLKVINFFWGDCNWTISESEVLYSVVLKAWVEGHKNNAAEKTGEWMHLICITVTKWGEEKENSLKSLLFNSWSPVRRSDGGNAFVLYWLSWWFSFVKLKLYV